MAIYKLLTFVASMALVGTITHAQVLSSGGCPSNIVVQPNFDVPAYLGIWYEYAKYPTIFEGNGICITAEYTAQDDGNVGVRNAQINGTTGEPEEIVGYASVVSNGKLKVTFPITPTYDVSSNYWVLGTDYKTYSVVYSCQSIGKLQHTTSVWILTRQRLPASSTIKCATAVLKRNNISLDPLTQTNQLNCNSENDQIDDNVVKGNVGDGFITDSKNEQINHNMVACRRRKLTHFPASKTQTKNKKRPMNSIWDFL